MSDESRGAGYAFVMPAVVLMVVILGFPAIASVFQSWRRRQRADGLAPTGGCWATRSSRARCSTPRCSSAPS